MTITLSVTGPGTAGVRIIHARDDRGPLLTVGCVSPVLPELAAPDGPRFSSVLWDVAGIRGLVTPRGGHAGPAGRTPEEVLSALQAQVDEGGAWWAWVTPDDLPAGTVIRVPADGSGRRPYGLENTGPVSQSKETGALTLTGKVLAQDGTTRRKRPSFRTVVVMPHQITILKKPEP